MLKPFQKQSFNDNVTLDDLKMARYRCAKFIKNLDEGYKLLPIFERLDNEIAHLEKQKLLLAKAYDMAEAPF